MDLSKKVPSPNSRIGTANSSSSDSARKNHAKMDFSKENDENCANFISRARDLIKEPKIFNSPGTSPTSRKKILAENNASLDANLEMIPQTKHTMGLVHSELPSQITPLSSRAHFPTDRNDCSSDAFCSPPYDPLTNYTSPRPEFLRYNPNRLREILQRVEKEKRCDEEGFWMGSTSSESSMSSHASFQDEEIRENEADNSDAEDDEVEDSYNSRRMGWRLLLLLGFFLSAFCYISSMSSIPASPSIDIGEDYRRTNEVKTYPGNLIPVLIGVSNVCLNATIGESKCGIGGFNNEVVSLHNLIEREEFERKESQGVLEEVATEYSSTADEDSEGIPAADNKQDEVVDIGMLTHTEQVAEGKSREDDYQENDALEQDTLSVADPELLSESFRPAFTEVAFSNSSLEQDVGFDDGSSIQSQEDFRQNTEGHGSVTVDEHLADQNRDAAKMSINTLVGSIWPRYMVHLLTCLSIMIGLSALYKYLLRSCKTSVPASAPLSHSVPPSAVVEAEAKISSIVSAKEQMNGFDFDAHLKPSDNYVKEHLELNRIRPPTVELLGEFSVVETTVRKTNSTPKLQRRDADLSEEPQLSQLRNSAKKSLPSSAYQNSSSPSESPLVGECIINKSSSVRKQLRKQDIGEQGDTAKVDVIPLRRSNRLRNRVTSP